jgi:hypothetical protein
MQVIADLDVVPSQLAGIPTAKLAGASEVAEYKLAERMVEQCGFAKLPECDEEWAKPSATGLCYFIKFG